MPFHFVRKVRFGDVDNAGIVYYPRFFHYCHEAFEELFGDGAYRRLIQDRKIGFPAVHVECDFRRPFQYGDTVRIEVSTQHLGEKSFTMRYRLSCVDVPEDLCAEVLVTCAVVDMTVFRSMPLPEDLCEFFAQFADSTLSPKGAKRGT